MYMYLLCQLQVYGDIYQTAQHAPHFFLLTTFILEKQNSAICGISPVRAMYFVWLHVF